MGGRTFTSLPYFLLMKLVQTRAKPNLIKWIRKLGVVGFLFFLVKGLAWLAITYFIIR